MNDIIRIESDERDPEPALPMLPEPKCPGIQIRPAVLGDFPFIDGLQKRHKKQVGFLHAGAIKGHIEKGNVLIAEAIKGAEGVGAKGSSDKAGETEPEAHLAPGPLSPSAPSPTLAPSSPDPLAPPPASPVGYLIAVDRYLKRDELGIIYQMNVVPAYQRSLVAANLLKEKFDRSAYGCRLYCCWCAQDLKANKFWEAMGFVPLAFRTGGGRRKKDGPRMHIFWQKRIRQGDSETPYWFPSLTGAGSIGEDRIVLPIPPGTHWSDAKPVVLPESPRGDEETKLLEAKVDELEKRKKGLKKGARGEGIGESGKAASKAKAAKAVEAGGLHFGPRKLSEAEAEAQERAAEAQAKQDEAAAIEGQLKEAKRAARKAKKKFDPAQEAFARELKDRWLEQVAETPGLLAAAPGAAKYEVSREIDPTMMESVQLENPERLRISEAA